jgi:TonB family protein
MKSFVFPVLLSLLMISTTGRTRTVQNESTDQSPALLEASRLSKMVVSLFNEGKMDEALPLAKRALEIREKALGSDHELVAMSLKNLASIYFALKKFDEASNSYQKCLSIYEKKFGENDPKILEILDTLTWSSYGSGDVRKAERCLQRALAIREKMFGPESKEVGITLYALGQFHHKLGNSGKAVEFYRRAIPITVKTLGPNDTEYRGLLEKCSCALMQVDKKEEADKMRREMVEAQQRTTGFEGSLIQGHAIHRAEPVYPIAAKQARLAGTVIVEVTVDEKGIVTDARAVCGPDLLVIASVEAARRWTFTPSLLKGVPVKVIGTLTFNYHL